MPYDTITDIDQLITRLHGYNPDAEADLVRRAYEFSAKAHAGQMRQSGEPYLQGGMHFPVVFHIFGLSIHSHALFEVLGYTIGSERVSLSPSIVGGYAFNSLTVTDVGAAAALPVEVGNSLAWRVGASAWFDVSRRFAINVSGGYLMTGLRLTVLDGGRLVRRDTRGDTALVHAGLAYKIF